MQCKTKIQISFFYKEFPKLSSLAAKVANMHSVNTKMTSPQPAKLKCLFCY